MGSRSAIINVHGRRPCSSKLTIPLSFALQIAAQMGMKVVALSGSDSKRKLATELGAHVYVDGSKEDFVDVLQKLGGAKVIACTAPNGELMSKAVNGLAVNGTLLIL